MSDLLFLNQRVLVELEIENDVYGQNQSESGSRRASYHGVFVLERGHTVCQHVVGTQHSRTEPELLDLSDRYIDSNTHADKMNTGCLDSQKVESYHPSFELSRSK